MALSAFAEQSKKISQLLAKSWLSNDPEGAEIKAALLEDDSDNIKAVFKKYGVDFDEFASPFSVDVSIDRSTLGGSILEEIEGPGQILKVNLPYPPQAEEVTDTQLTEWINNDDPDTVYPPYAYIPLSSGT